MTKSLRCHHLVTVYSCTMWYLFCCFSQKTLRFWIRGTKHQTPKSSGIPAASTSTSTGESPGLNQTKGARIVTHPHPVGKVGFRHIVTRIRRDDHVKSQNPHWWPQELVFFFAPPKKGRPPGDEIGDPYKWPNIKMGFSGRGYFIPTYRRKQLTPVVTDRGPPWTDDVSLCLRLPRWVGDVVIFLVSWKQTIKRSVHQNKIQLSPLWNTFRVWNCMYNDCVFPTTEIIQRIWFKQNMSCWRFFCFQKIPKLFLKLEDVHESNHGKIPWLFWSAIYVKVTQIYIDTNGSRLMHNNIHVMYDTCTLTNFKTNSQLPWK